MKGAVALWSSPLTRVTSDKSVYRKNQSVGQICRIVSRIDPELDEYLTGRLHDAPDADDASNVAPYPGIVQFREPTTSLVK